MDPLQTVRWLHNALPTQGVETQYVTCPDEGNELERPANRREMLELVTASIDRHVGAVD